MARLGATRAYGSPFEQQPVKAAPAVTPFGGYDENVPQDLYFQEAPRGFRGNTRYRPGNAYVMGGTPVGASGVKQYHAFDADTAFVVDYDRKLVPLPTVTQAVRESAFQPFQANRKQFHIRPGWARHNGRYPRFSFINTIIRTGPSEQQLNRAESERKLFGIYGQRPAQRFTRVLRLPRQDATPGEYGTYGI